MLNDLRTGWRSLRRSPLFTLTAAASLALGIGACTIIFSVVYTLLLRPLPYPDPEELIHVGMGNPLYGEELAVGGLPAPTLKQLHDEPGAGFSVLGGFNYDYINLTGIATPTQLLVGQATVDYLRVFAIPARLGRIFDAADCRAASPPTVVLSDAVWRRQFGADQDIVGRTVTLADRPHTVIGVMPRGFKDASNSCDLWVPAAEDGPAMSASNPQRFVTIGRLRGGPDRFARTSARLATVSANLAQSDPANFKGWRMELHPMRAVIVSTDTNHALWLLFGAVGCVLLVTCANVANLQLVRSGARRREVGVRLALGASRARILRLCLAESLLLALLGGGLGLLAAGWGVDVVAALLPPGSSPFQDEVSLSWPVVGFSFLVVALTGGITGLLPAWVASRQDPAGSLGSGGRGASEGTGGPRTRAALVVLEIALALVLLVGAGLMTRSFLATLRTSAGLRTDQTIMLNLSISETRYKETDQRREYLRRLLETTAAVPGVTGSAVSTTEPFNWLIDMRFLLSGQAEGSPEALRQTAAYDAVNPAYFATLEIPLLQGRAFDASDTAAAPPVVVVNAAFVRHFLPDGIALGRKFSLVGSRNPAPVEIVGVAGDVRRNGLDKEAPPQMYVCCFQRPQTYCTLYVRAAGDLSAEGLAKGVQAAVWQVDPDQPIGKVTTLARAVSGSVAPARLYMVLFGGFAAMALLLAVLGIYGTVAYSVNQRTRELGIRLALGAQRGNILRLVLGQGARLVAAGVVIGLLASTGLGRLLTALLYGVKPTDPATLAGVAVLLGTTALAASYFPARRAMNIDPLTALRDE